MCASWAPTAQASRGSGVAPGNPLVAGAAAACVLMEAPRASMRVVLQSQSVPVAMFSAALAGPKRRLCDCDDARESQCTCIGCLCVVTGVDRLQLATLRQVSKRECTGHVRRHRQPESRSLKAMRVCRTGTRTLYSWESSCCYRVAVVPHACDSWHQWDRSRSPVLRGGAAETAGSAAASPLQLLGSSRR